MSDSLNSKKYYSAPGYSGGLNPLGIIDRLNLTIHIRRYIKIVFQRWLILLACTIAGLAYQGYKAYTAEDIYQAESRMKIAPKVSYRSGGEAEILESGMSFYEDQIEYMRSGDVLARAEKEMRDYKPASGITPKITDRIAQKGQGSTINMYVRSTDLDHAQKYAKAWVEAFESYLVDRNRQLIGSEQRVIEKRLNDERRKQEEKQRELAQFIENNDLSAINDIYSKQSAQYERELTRLTAMREALEKQSLEEFASTQAQSRPNFEFNGDTLDSVQNLDTSARASSSKIDQDATSRYNELSLDLKRFREELKKIDGVVYPEHPYYKKLVERIESATISQQYYLEMARELRNSEIERLKSEESNLEAKIADLKQKIEDSLRVRLTHETLVTNVEYYKGRVQVYDNALQSILSAEESENKFEILRRGEPTSLSPILPNRKKMVFTGFVGGIALGLAIIYLLHRLDDRMELAEDIEEELEEPILGQIPQLDTALFRESKILVTSLDPHNIYSEAIRGIRSAIMFGSNQDRKQVMAITSAIPGDGKTSFTVNFSITLARSNTRTLLVDCDLRRGNVERYFNGAQDDPGISEVLSGQLHWTDVIQKTEITTLDYISTGAVEQAPSELLISPIMAQFLEQARTTYDHIIFDCPPLTGIDDSFSLIRLVDGFLFVVKAGHTPMRFAKNALESIQQREANILGVVLNGVLPDNPAYYYTYYYHDYYKDQARMEPPKAGNASDFKTALSMPAPRKRTHASSTLPASDHEQRTGPRRSPNPSMSLVEQTTKLDSSQVAEMERRKAEEFKKRRAKSKNATVSPSAKSDTTESAPHPRQTSGTRPAPQNTEHGSRPVTGSRPTPSQIPSPGQRPAAGTRPAPTQKSSPGQRPAGGTRPAPAQRPSPGQRPAAGTRPAPAQKPSHGPRPVAGTRPAPAQSPSPNQRPAAGTRPAPSQRPVPGPHPAAGTRPSSAQRPTPGPRPAGGTRPAPAQRPTPGPRPAGGTRPAPAQRSVESGSRSAVPDITKGNNSGSSGSAQNGKVASGSQAEREIGSKTASKPRPGYSSNGKAEQNSKDMAADKISRSPEQPNPHSQS